VGYGDKKVPSCLILVQLTRTSQSGRFLIFNHAKNIVVFQCLAGEGHSPQSLPADILHSSFSIHINPRLKIKPGEISVS
jgi:hypothetical protein